MTCKTCLLEGPGAGCKCRSLGIRPLGQPGPRRCHVRCCSFRLREATGASNPYWVGLVPGFVSAFRQNPLARQRPLAWLQCAEALPKEAHFHPVGVHGLTLIISTCDSDHVIQSNRHEGVYIYIYIYLYLYLYTHT